MNLSGWTRLWIVAAVLAGLIVLLSIMGTGEPAWLIPLLAAILLGPVGFALIYTLMRMAYPPTDPEKREAAARRAKFRGKLKPPIH